MRIARFTIVAAAAALLSACAVRNTPIPIAPRVDIDRFMGDWYVIAHIPTFLEKNAYSAVESYRRLPDGRIATTFRFREGGFEGPEKVYTPTGFVRPDTGNAVWGMQFVWPVKAEYVISWLKPDYSQVVIGRNKRDYVWVMARTARIPEDELALILAELGRQGYDTAAIRRVPHPS
ncbi:MAG: lipocalin family protein [Gammaproteobacteria bacterium]